MSNKLFENTGILTRFMLRRERMRIVIWLAGLVSITLLVALAFVGMFHNDAERMAMSVTMSNPAMIAMVGPNYGPEHYTTGVMMANEMLLFTMLAVIIMNIFMVNRHTRRDEERGRQELLRSLPLGRLSTLGATISMALIVNTLIAVISGMGLYALRLEGMNLEGCMLYGVAMGVIGMLFAVLTALFSQLFSSSRGVTGYSFALMGVMYLMRAAGDINNEALSLSSPLGLILRSKIFVENKWWPIFVTLGVTAVLLVVSFYLNSIRDLGQGFVAAKKGKANASKDLSSSFGLAVRLLRSSIIAWAIGVFVLGATYGSVMGDMEGFLENNQMLKAVMTQSGTSMTEQFISMLMSVLAMLCAIPVMNFLFKLKSEEGKSHVEHLLVRSLSRERIMRDYVFISGIGSVVMMFLAVFGLWSVGITVSDEVPSFLTCMKAGMVYLPALWIMIGLGVFLIGNIPKQTKIVWVYLGYSFFAVYLGTILKMPEWTAKLSPFGDIPQVLTEEFNVLPIIIESIIAIGLVVAGFVGYRKRDIA